MAETKAKLTPEEKVAARLPLNEYERIQLDAHRLTLRRIRENQEDQKLRAEMAQVPRTVDVPSEKETKA